jgi:small subunit ribosomal protein S1
LIEEVSLLMELNEKEINALYSDAITEIEERTILKGKVVSIISDSVVVDIGYKSEGFVPINEFTEREREELKDGVEVEVYVSKIDADGAVILSTEKARRIRVFQALQEAFKNNAPVEARVLEKVKGGYSLDIDGIKAFLPGSQADLRPVRNPDSLLGQSIKVKVLKLNNKLTNVIVSRRVILEEELAALREKTLSQIEPGKRVQGTVKNITDYGVFIDIGGVDGLLHVSDISWGRVRHPSDFFKIGQEVEVLVNSYDPEEGKVTLSYKHKNPNPWLNIEEKYPVGKVVRGKVVNLTSYGAFVELEEGVDGLVHVSELDWTSRPKHPSNYVEIGDYVSAQVLKVDPVERKISLGIKQLKPKPWELVAKRYKVDQKVTGRVRSFTEFGTFVELPEGVDALLHISDMSWTRHIKHPSEVLRKGQKIEAIVLSLDPENERMSLGLKQVVPDPWKEEIPSKYKVGDEVRCRGLRYTEHGIFVEIEDEIEGLIYSSEIDTPRDELKENFKPGEEFIARIIKMDIEGRKIGLSLRNIKDDMEEVAEQEEISHK